MIMKGTIAALIVAAGKGERTGGFIPKQYTKIAGKALVAHGVDGLSSCPEIGGIFIVIADGQQDILAEALGDRMVAAVIPGGALRQDSVRAGLEWIANMQIFDSVLIHDAARPFLPKAVLDRLISALKLHDGAVPVLPIVDTLAHDDGRLGATVDRQGLSRVQTPQAFRLDAILTSHRLWQNGVATDDAQMARAAGFDIATVEGDPMLEKITHAPDFAAAEARLAASFVSRTGMGFDVHRLEAGEELWLCGVKVPHDMGLAGHSDADVALHALVDAVLGAIAQGDIGSHFPPSDPQWRGAPSSRFVEYARDLVATIGGVIDHVDITLICEAPKIAPHRDAMRRRVAALLGITEGSVSIKATTTERLGLTGRGEGIAAQAVATVRARKA